MEGWHTVSCKSVLKIMERQGIDAIIVNGFSWGFVGFMVMGLLLCAWESKGKVCLIGLAVHFVLTIVVLQFPIFKWVSKGSTGKRIIGVIAGIFQNLAELIPIAILVQMWSAKIPEEGYPNIQNYKKFIIITRSFDSIATLYWMLYCVFTYEFDEFGISSIICGGLSLISLCAHSAWAIKPK